MTNFIPIFPLDIVVYPGEQLNLHIFEPRYKQLIKECFASKKPFGIPPIINNKISETGTTVNIVEITTEYEDGKMDIKTLGSSIFNILEVVNELPEKLYSGAIVNYPTSITTKKRVLMNSIIAAMRTLHKLLNINKDFKKDDADLWSYDVHHAGLSLLQEYELLQLAHELQRQEYLRLHLQTIMPLIAQMETLKDRIKLNGHFKNPGSFNL